MTDVDTPVEIELDEAQIEDLKDGETVEVTLVEDGDRRDLLEIVWKTEIEMDVAPEWEELLGG